jgi:hypothetical protein
MLCSIVITQSQETFAEKTKSASHDVHFFTQGSDGANDLQSFKYDKKENGVSHNNWPEYGIEGESKQRNVDESNVAYDKAIDPGYKQAAIGRCPTRAEYGTLAAIVTPTYYKAGVLAITQEQKPINEGDVLKIRAAILNAEIMAMSNSGGAGKYQDFHGLTLENVELSANDLKINNNEKFAVTKKVKVSRQV